MLLLFFVAAKPENPTPNNKEMSKESEKVIMIGKVVGIVYDSSESFWKYVDRLLDFLIGKEIYAEYCTIVLRFKNDSIALSDPKSR